MSNTAFRLLTTSDPVSTHSAGRNTASCFVDEDYLKEIVGITFDSATTEDQLNHRFTIKKLLFRGMENSDIAD